MQFHQSNKKIRMVTYIKPDEFESILALYGTLFQDSQSRFAQCMMHDSRWCSPFDRPEDGRFVKNYNGNIAEIYINGFKDFCERYDHGF